MSDYNKNTVEVGDYIKIKGYPKFYKVDYVFDEGVSCHDDGWWHDTGADFNEITDLRLNGEVPGTNFR